LKLNLESRRKVSIIKDAFQARRELMYPGWIKFLSLIIYPITLYAHNKRMLVIPGSPEHGVRENIHC